MVNSIIIKKGEKLPAKASRSFYTITKGQTKVDCRVTESDLEEIDPAHVDVLNKDQDRELALPPGRPPGQEIRVTYEYQIDQTVRCFFEDVNSGLKKEFLVSISRKNANHAPLKKFTVE